MTAHRRRRLRPLRVGAASATALVCLPSLLWVLLGPSVAAADPGPPARDGFCDRPFTARDAFASEAATDLYNGVLWMAGTATIDFTARSKSRWTKTNGFDTGIRSGLRAGGSSNREDAALASDVMLGLSAGALPLASIGWTLYRGDCHGAWDMTTDALESIFLTQLLTEATKSIAGRERPFVRKCDRADPPSDADCGGDDRQQSFWSGHAATAAAGAGVSCAWAIKRRTWGESGTARAAPCVLGAGAALGSGVLRIIADKHWTTDVLMGFAVGGTIGWFDTWGPFDLLRFDARTDDGAWDLHGLVVPYAADGEVGARLHIAF